LRKLKTDCDRTAIETLAQLASPVVDDDGAMLDDRLFEGGGTGNLKANVVLAICPVDADERCKF
jgi:hypothetical protein